jgi:hypothetical protein
MGSFSMTASCQPLPQSVAEEMLQVVARAICDRPGESPAQRDSRTGQMVHATMGMQPRDGLEYMLSTMLFGHYQLILHSMRELFHGQTESMNARTKSTIVALDRAVLGILKELRIQRKRPLAGLAEIARTEVAAEQTPVSPPLDPAAFMADMTRTPPEVSEQEKDEPDMPEQVVPDQTQHPIEDTIDPTARPAATVEGQASMIGVDCPDDMPSWADEGTIEERLATLGKLLGTVGETLEAARALDNATTAAASAD